MTRTPDQMIASEVLCCMSSLVATLAYNYGAAVTHVDAAGRRSTDNSDLSLIVEQAFDLAAPILDYEEGAIQAGWSQNADGTWSHMGDTEEEPVATAQTACDVSQAEPVDREIYEHWAVTDWFADKLEAAGEKVDRDFAGLCVWARTTTGQNMTMDGVVQRIYAFTHQQEALLGDELEASGWEPSL